MSASHHITLNGKGAATGATTLDQLLSEQGYDIEKVATALNGAFVPLNQRAATPIKSGDSVEVVSIRQGG